MKLVFLLLFAFTIHSGATDFTQQNKTISHNENQVHLNPKTGYPQLLIFSQQPGAAKSTLTTQEMRQQTAKAYIAQNRELFGITPSAELKLIRKQSSLIGDHFIFSHLLNGMPVADSTLTISINKHNGIYKVFSSIAPEAIPIDQENMTAEEALEYAWNHLRIHGPVLSQPSVEKLYFNYKNQITPGFRVQIIASKPSGNWQVDVHGQSGAIIQMRSMSSKTHRDAQDGVSQYHGPILSMEEALDTVKKTTQVQKTAYVNGSGLVFDPDPRTTLVKDDLTDSSPSTEFEAAYVQRTLRDITQNGTYSLAGPYCQISNMEAPNSLPSTTDTGNWEAKRGELAFYDVMCYYHVDTSQRHVQSLGFTGDKSIMAFPLDVDSNGQNGADNSAFMYNYNSTTGEIYNTFLTFGHGGVPDDEDADVIIHEYGHALNFSIVGNFFGGDTGAIAEGFSDYWAASYRIGLTNGLVYHPSWVFHWDAHSNSTWRGRYLNAFTAEYHDGTEYRAHYSIANGWITDELWSTPIFQALLSAVAQGYPRSEMDAIILEGFYGMGPGTRIPQQAASIVAAAATLYPDKPYADILSKNFMRHGILSSETGFQYYASHVPPAGATATAWQSEITLSNTTGETIQVAAFLYEKDDETGNFGLTETESLTLNANSTIVYIPTGENQRWVMFDSSTKLMGTLSFYRTVDESKTEERVSIPLAEGQQLEQHLVFPHVPAHRSRFWSGGVLLNPTGNVQSIQFKLIGSNGSDLTSLLSPEAPTSLQPYEKMVTFFADGLFSDEHSDEKVDYIEVTGSTNLIGFELFGYQPGEAFSATSGIATTSFFNRSTYTARSSLDEVDWSGFVLVNPYDAPVRLNIRVLAASGIEQAQTTHILSPKQKLMGLNDKDAGFTFPYGTAGTPSIELPAGTSVAWIIVESETPFKLFELAGDYQTTLLDGTAVWGECTEVYFTKPTGTLEIINGPTAGTLTVSARDDSGQEVFGLTSGLNAWEPMTMDLTEYDIASLSITGVGFFAYVVEKDSNNGSLTIRGGSTNP